MANDGYDEEIKKAATYIDAPSEGRDASAIDGVLVDRNDLLILQDAEHILAYCGELSVRSAGELRCRE